MGNIPIIYERKKIFTADHADTMVNRVELSDAVQSHGHNFIEIALAAGGRGKHISANGQADLQTGDVMVIRPGAWHGFSHCAGLIIYNCCFGTELLQRELGWLREDPTLNYLLWVGPLAKNRRGVLSIRLLESQLPECLECLERLGRVQNSLHRNTTLGHLLIFLDSLARAVDAAQDPDPHRQPLHPAVLDTLRLLEGELHQRWTLGELAARVHLTPSYLVRLFKGDIGLAPMAYLNRCRIESAAGLLLHTHIPIADIAAQVGWYDPNLFARRFRAAYRMSASEYRSRFGV